MEHWLSLGFVREVDQLVELGRLAESLGFTGVTVADHLVYPQRIETRYPYTPDGKTFWPADNPWPDPWVTLTAIGTATRELRLASNIYLMALRDPFTAARAVGTASILTNGRVACGVAEGWMPEEYALAGVPFASRGERLDEMVSACRALFTGEPVRHDGRHIRFDEVRMLPAPSKPIPFWGGGASPRALRRVATLLDGWLGLAYTPEQLIPTLEKLQAMRREAGRGDEKLDVLIGLRVRPTAELLRDLEARGVTGLISTPFFGLPMDVSSFDAKRTILEKYAKHVIEGTR